jgi:hypothetical protein
MYRFRPQAEFHAERRHSNRYVHRNDEWVIRCGFASWKAGAPAWIAPLPPLAFCVLAYWMSRSTHSGRCAACGYTLVGLPTAPGDVVVCPECSRVNAPAKGAA